MAIAQGFQQADVSGPVQQPEHGLQVKPGEFWDRVVIEIFLTQVAERVGIDGVAEQVQHG